jgi:regulator of protease activity HflC (stomatin/prohibitin superfamily)
MKGGDAAHGWGAAWIAPAPESPLCSLRFCGLDSCSRFRVVLWAGECPRREARRQVWRCRMLTVRIKRHERGLRFRYGEYRSLLGPGVYRLWGRLLGLRLDTIEVVSTLSTRFEHPLLEVLVRDAALRDELIVVELAETQRALVWRDGRLLSIVGPGRYAYWKAPARVEIEVYDVGSLRFTHPRLEAIVAHPDASRWLDSVEVDPHAEVLLLVNGELSGRLAPGRHAFWKGGGRVRVMPVDRRELAADVAGQEIMTSDKVTLRVNLAAVYRVVDAVRAVTVVSDYAQSLYREAQLALRASVGTRTLDQLLADKDAVGGEVRTALATRAAEFGVEVRSVGLKDIILPGDMKAILNQVIEAQKRAEADLIRRREETASARSQANTARLLAENPALARLKELEMLQAVLAGSKATFVFGSGDIAEQVRRLVSQPEGPAQA